MNGTGVFGQNAADGQRGIWGIDNSAGGGYGVFGETGSGIGVYGTLGAGQSGLLGAMVAAVIGDSSTTNGVIGLSGTEVGVSGQSVDGYGMKAQGGLAPIQLLPATSSGAPTSGAHALGELYVDNKGVLYRCAAAGTPGVWVPSYSVVPLSKPVRIISTPSGTGNTGGLTGPFNATGATNTTTALTGGSTGIPANAVGVVANLALSANGSVLNGDGFLTLFPAGTTNPGTASLNAGGDAYATSNGVTVAFGTGADAGKLSFSWQGGGSPQPCQVYLDVTAYIL